MQTENSICEEMLAACEAFPSGLLLRPENETLPRMAVAAADLATYAVAAGPDRLPEARLKIEQITAVCRAAYQKNPRSFPLACGLAHSLHATARVRLNDGSDTDLRPIFDEAADLLIRSDSGPRRSALPLVWSISRTATEWAGRLLDHPDLTVATSALILAQRFTVHLRRCGDERQEIMVQRAQIYLYQSRLACRSDDRDKATRSSNLALSTLRPRQQSDPEKDSLALLTAEALSRGGGMQFESLDTSNPAPHHEIPGTAFISPDCVNIEAYDWHWAQHILSMAFGSLESETKFSNDILPELRPWILADPGDATLKQLAQSLGRTHAALRAQLYRLRKTWRQTVREAVSQTVSHPDEIDDELRHLAAVLSRQMPE